MHIDTQELCTSLGSLKNKCWAFVSHLILPIHTFQSHSETYIVDLEIQGKPRQTLNSKSLKDKGQLLLPTCEAHNVLYKMF